MKALTDKITSLLQDCYNVENVTKDYKKGIEQALKIIELAEKNAKFEEIARVMMKHLGDVNKYHPHHTVIITNTTAELVEGIRSVGRVMDYVKD